MDFIIHTRIADEVLLQELVSLLRQHSPLVSHHAEMILVHDFQKTDEGLLLTLEHFFEQRQLAPEDTLALFFSFSGDARIQTWYMKRPTRKHIYRMPPGHPFYKY